jgi:hypothetical protein
VPLMETHLYIILIRSGPLGLVCHPQPISTHILHIEDIPFCNTFSFEVLIFVSLRQDSKFLKGLSFSLLDLHILRLYGNNPT